MTDGYNFRNHELCAVLGLSQLKKLDKNIEIRKHNYRRYYNGILFHKGLGHHNTRQVTVVSLYQSFLLMESVSQILKGFDA